MSNEAVARAQVPLRTCKDHGDLQDMFCVDCEESICLICGQQNHTSHDWGRRNTIQERVKSELAELCHHVRHKRVPLLQAEVEKVKTLKNDYEKIYLEKMDRITSHTETVVKSLQKISDDLIRQCKLLKFQNEDKLDQKQKEIETFVLQFELNLKSVEEESKSVSLSKLLQIKKQVQSIPYPEKLNKKDTTLHLIDFRAGDVKENVLQSVLGEVYQTYNKVTVAKIFEAKKGTKMIKYISPISETHAWYREFRSSENVLIDINKGSTESACMFGETRSDHIPDDFITIKSGVSIYTWHAGHCVMKVTPPKIKESEVTANKVVKLADLSPLFPVGICATKDGRFLVSAIDTTAFSEDIYTSSQPKKSVVLVLSESGKTKKVFQNADDDKTPLFLYPTRMAENTNSDICVIDRTGMSNGKLVVISSTGKLKFHYQGNGPNQADFDPRGICCDSSGHILISDCNNRSVHLLNKEGSFLTYLIKTDEELWSMSLYMNTLWIGGKNGIIYAYRYQVDTT